MTFIIDILKKVLAKDKEATYKIQKTLKPKFTNLNMDYAIPHQRKGKKGKHKKRDAYRKGGAKRTAKK